MAKLIMLKGIPGSGKSAWAEQYIKEHPETKRVNNDTLRLMLDNGKWSKEREKHISVLRETMIDYFLSNNISVIVDNLNLSPKHEAHYTQVAKKYNAEFIVTSFLDVPLHVCIERDSKRTGVAQVGSKVIFGHWKRFVEPLIVKPVYNPLLPDCIICDLDGSFFLFGDKNPYDRDFENDTVNYPVRDIVWNEQSSTNTYIIFVSGRLEKFRTPTELALAWALDRKDHQLFMRKDGDNRADYIVKEEIYREHILGKYNVKYVVDDRKSVCRMWVSLGLFVFNVNQYDIEF